MMATTHCAYTKVGQPRPTSGVKADVVGLEVPVCYVLAVQVPQRKRKLRRTNPVPK